MKKRFFVSMILSLFAISFIVSAFADSKTVQLGETGITFQADSSYEVITPSNKKNYSQDIQRQITGDNELLLYSADKGTIFFMYDQGDDFLQYDVTGKKAEEIKDSYAKFGKDIETLFGVDDYDLSIYDSGLIKWVRIDVPQINLVWFITCQGRRMATVYYNSSVISDKTGQSVLDSFKFGSPSLWSSIKKIVGSITDFGDRILGRVGVYTIWSIIFVAFVSIISFISSGIKAIFKKKFSR